LIEGEGVDSAVHRAGGQVSRHPLIDDDNAGAGPDLPPPGSVHPIQRFLIHEEQRVAIFLNARLQAVGSSGRSVMGSRFAMDEENSFAPLGADDKARFYNIWKNQNSACLGENSSRSRIVRHELVEGGAGLDRQVIRKRGLTREQSGSGH